MRDELSKMSEEMQRSARYQSLIASQANFDKLMERVQKHLDALTHMKTRLLSAEGADSSGTGDAHANCDERLVVPYKTSRH